MTGEQVGYKFKVGDPVVATERKNAHWAMQGGTFHLMVEDRRVEEETGRKLYKTTRGEYYEEDLTLDA